MAMNLTEAVKYIDTDGKRYIAGLGISWLMEPGKVTVIIEVKDGTVQKSFDSFEEAVIAIGEIIKRESSPASNRNYQ